MTDVRDYDARLDDYNWLAQEVDRNEGDQAKALGVLFLERFHPKSVIDLGCSSGIYLVPFLEAGVEIRGVDGASGVGGWIPGNFEVADLRQPYYPPHKYDLAYCIETLEHIRAEFSDIVVESICRCSDTVFLSSARRGQNGEGHVNCQDRGYWQEKFGRFGYGVHPRNDEIMSVVNTDPVYQIERTMWLRANGMLLGKM